MDLEQLKKRSLELQKCRDHIQQQFFVVSGQIAEIESQIKQLTPGDNNEQASGQDA